MPIPTFNETFLGNADVPEVGYTSVTPRPANYDTRTAATGNPAGVQSFDPAANLRTTAVTKQATRANTSGGNAKFKPSAVQSFNGETV